MARAARNRKPRRRRANPESPAATPAGRPRNPEEGSRGGGPGRVTGPRGFRFTPVIVGGGGGPPPEITADIRVGSGAYVKSGVGTPISSYRSCAHTTKACLGVTASRARP